jgi:hypothetical protein
MPPNRKTVAGLVETLSSGDLQDLQSSVQPKFQPLTHPEEETRHLEKQPVESKQIESSYWDWPADRDSKKAAISGILADERARELVSGANIEKIESTASATKGPSQVTAAKQANDAYWQWNSNKVASHTADPSHPNNNYWDWDSEGETKSAQIKATLQYEAARKLLSADHMVQRLQTAVPASSNRQQSSSDDYWSW